MKLLPNEMMIKKSLFFVDVKMKKKGSEEVQIKPSVLSKWKETKRNQACYF